MTLSTWFSRPKWNITESRGNWKIWVQEVSKVHTQPLLYAFLTLMASIPSSFSAPLLCQLLNLGLNYFIPGLLKLSAIYHFKVKPTGLREVKLPTRSWAARNKYDSRTQAFSTAVYFLPTTARGRQRYSLRNEWQRTRNRKSKSLGQTFQGALV